MTSLTPEAYAVIEGRHSDPFRYLGPHVENGSSVVRIFLPDAEGVALVDEQGHESDLQRIHDAGLFEGRLGTGPRHYRLRARYGQRQVEIEDPYRFPPILSDLDLYPLGEGRHMHLYEKLGAHRPAIMASRLASMRLAIAISPWRESNSIGPIVRRYMRTGSSVRSGGSLASDLAGTFCWTSTSSPLPLSASSSDTSRCSSPSSLASL